MPPGVAAPEGEAKEAEWPSPGRGTLDVYSRGKHVLHAISCLTKSKRTVVGGMLVRAVADVDVVFKFWHLF